MFASSVVALREEISAILLTATPQDTVLLKLDSSGGTVMGYGLAAAQLTRLKASGLKLHIFVDQVAASGGYMMACVRDDVTASPFAMIGSIGVLSVQPNVTETLKKIGAEVEEVTAGKFKRTMAPYKKSTVEERAKVQEDVDLVHRHFKDWIMAHRGGKIADIDALATWETWLATDALERHLIDHVGLFDDAALRLRKEGYDLLKVRFKKTNKTWQQMLQARTEQTLYGDSGSAFVNGGMVEQVIWSLLQPFRSSPPSQEGRVPQYWAVSSDPHTKM